MIFRHSSIKSLLQIEGAINLTPNAEYPNQFGAITGKGGCITFAWYGDLINPQIYIAAQFNLSVLAVDTLVVVHNLETEAVLFTAELESPFDAFIEADSQLLLVCETTLYRYDLAAKTLSAPIWIPEIITHVTVADDKIQVGTLDAMSYWVER